MRTRIEIATLPVTICMLLFSCRSEAAVNNISDYLVDITFEGLLRKCPQYGGATSDKGTLIGTCTFTGDNFMKNRQAVTATFHI
ncbi:MAG: hypothetical protein JNL95_00295 [Chitinophagales bacterium]|nr:hypothetical protein [Chitinophagales bacterium]